MKHENILQPPRGCCFTLRQNFAMVKKAVVSLAMFLPALMFGATIWTAGDGNSVWTENFESMAAGDLLSGTVYDTGNTLISSAGAATKEIQNNTRFGTSSNTLRHYTHNNSTTWVQLDMKDTSQAHNFVRLQFDFFHAWRSSDAATYHTHVRLTDSEGEDVARLRFRPDSRQLDPEGSYTNSTPQAFDLWFNNTSESLTYQNPYNPADIRTLSPQMFDLYVQGGIQVSNKNSISSPPTDANAITGVHIYGHGTSQAEYFFNNFEMSAIPEPRTYAMIFGFLVIGVTMILRRKRQ